MSTAEPPHAPELEPHDSPHHPMVDFFADWRRVRRERYASRPARVRSLDSCAVLTILQNEPIFFPIWLAYYSRFFAASDIYVLDHDTDDGSTAGAGFVRIPVSHKTFDNTWMVSTVEHHQLELLKRYDVVLVVDVDEIVAPEPTWGTLGDYLTRFDEEWVNCLGYEVLHMRDREPPFRPDLPVLGQRAHWYANDLYDKPSISSVPLKWRPGFHGRADFHMNPDPDLRLIHLHRMDFEVAKARHRRWRSRPWNRRDVKAGWGTHNRVTGDSEFATWFYEDSTVPAISIVPEPIPSAWRAVV